MPAGKIKESLWLGTARIFLSSVRGQGGVRQLDGALGGLWGLGWPPKPKRPRVQVPAESNQGEIWECHSCSQQQRCSVAQLSLPLFQLSLVPLFPSLQSPPLTFLDRHTLKKLHTLNMKPELYVCWYVCFLCLCVGVGTRLMFVCKLVCVCVLCVNRVSAKPNGIKTIVEVQSAGLTTVSLSLQSSDIFVNVPVCCSIVSVLCTLKFLQFLRDN